ncbi:MAG: T9SS type A sorting domain-containing protein [Ignavibacteria bacterium]|nr:T9SS type A sorting domain-containing protein [Ignavibacteria bacterium]
MKKMLLSMCAIFMTCGVTMNAQNYTSMSVKDVAAIPTDSLLKGSLQSPKIGDTVKMTGIVSLPPVVNYPTDNRKIMIAGNVNWSVFLRDTNFTLNEFAGVLVVCDTNNTASNFNRLRIGQLVEMTVKVTNFPVNSLGAIQALLIANSTVNFIDEGISLPPLPKVKISDFVLGPIPAAMQFTTGAKYVGMKVEFNDVIVASSVVSGAQRTTIILTDAAGNQMYLRDQSNYYRTDAVKIGSFVAPQVGQKINSLKGYITSNSVAGQTVSFMISPAMPEDLVIDANSAPPVIVSTRSTRSNAIPTPSETVPISINITKGKSDLKYVQVKYSVNGGTMTAIDATKVSETLYTANIPAQAANSLVRWKAEISDVDNTVVKFPTADTAVFYYRVLDRAPMIKDIREQFTTTGGTVYGGFYVTLEATVSADASDIPNALLSAPRVYIQDGEDGYSALVLNSTSPASKIRAFSRWDKVRVRGVIVESFGVTMLDSIANTDAALLPGPGVKYPPKRLKTKELAGKRSGDPAAEQWESMMIELENVVVADTNADAPGNFGEFNCVDSTEFGGTSEGSSRLRVETDDGNTQYATKSASGKVWLQRGQRITSLKGILLYSFSNYKVVPRQNEDVILGSVSVDENENENPLTQFAMTAFPNPMQFNGSVELSFNVPTSAIVKIYDATGQNVSEIGSIEYPAGTFHLNLKTGQLSNGVYTCVVETSTGTNRSMQFVILR